MLDVPVARAGAVRIDWCPVERLPELQAFLDTYWRRGHVLARDEPLLRWQHGLAQGGERLSVLIAEEGGRLVGSLGLIARDVGLAGTRRPGAWLTTWVAVPEFRNRLVGVQLIQRVITGDYGLVGTIGQNAVARQLLTALGFDIWDDIPRWVRVISPKALTRLLGPASRDVRPHALEPGPPAASSIRLVRWSEAIAERWDAAWQERFAPRLLGTWRDADYLRWRYVEHPRFRYAVHFAQERTSGALTGLLVYRLETVRDRQVKVLRIVELLSEGAAGGVLGRAVLQAGEEEGVALADFYCTAADYAAPLEAVGFVREDTLPVRLPSRFQPLEGSREPLGGAFWMAPELSRRRSPSPGLYVTRADCDQDRPN